MREEVKDVQHPEDKYQTEYAYEYTRILCW